MAVVLPEVVIVPDMILAAITSASTALMVALIRSSATVMVAFSPALTMALVTSPVNPVAMMSAAAWSSTTPVVVMAASSRMIDPVTALIWMPSSPAVIVVPAASVT